jgi:hypothetical protein
MPIGKALISVKKGNEPVSQQVLIDRRQSQLPALDQTQIVLKMSGPEIAVSEFEILPHAADLL